MDVKVKVRCVVCKKTREIGSGEIDKNDYPICVPCMMPMVPVEATAK